MPVASAVFLAGAVLSAPFAQSASEPPALTSSLRNSDQIYSGWRASNLIGEPVESAGKDIGEVRDVLVSFDGKVAAVVVFGGSRRGVPDYVLRVPWSAVDLTPGASGIKIEAPDENRSGYRLFEPGDASLPKEFRAGDVIGDYVRVQSGYGYGVVTDIVFGKSGDMIAVLAVQDRQPGRAAELTAFPFTGVQGQWDPGLPYFGLPYPTLALAEKAAIKLDRGKLRDGSLSAEWKAAKGQGRGGGQMCTGDDSAEMRRPGPANPRELIMRSRKMSSHVAVWNRAGTNERMLYIRVQVWGFSRLLCLWIKLHLPRKHCAFCWMLSHAIGRSFLPVDDSAVTREINGAESIDRSHQAGPQPNEAQSETVSGIKPGPKRIVWDDGLPGFGVLVYPGACRFIIEFRDSWPPSPRCGLRRRGAHVRGRVAYVG